MPHEQSPAAEHPFAFVESHAEQAPPPAPHSANDGAEMQVAPLQHPVEHDAASHTHLPPEQACPTAHSVPPPHEQSPAAEHPSERVESHAVHRSPSTPHVDADRALHVGPEQHPAHDAAHPLHVPCEHVSPPGQLWHALPPLPQAGPLFPAWQTVPAQQPVGHEAPSHTHAPFKQC